MSKVLFSIPLDDHLQLHMLIYSRIGSIVSFIDGSLNFMLSSDVTHYPFQRTALKTTAAALVQSYDPLLSVAMRDTPESMWRVLRAQHRGTCTAR